MSELPIVSHTHFSDNIYGVVTAGITDVQSKADLAVAETSDLIDRLNNTLNSLQNVPQFDVAALGNVTATVDDFVAQTKPTRPTINSTYPEANELVVVDTNYPLPQTLLAIDTTFTDAPASPGVNPAFGTSPALLDATPSFPADPGDATLGNVNELVIDDVPVLTAAEPVVRDIAAPARFDKVAPVANALPDRAFPNKPGYTLPTAPTLRTLTLPAAPTILEVNFEGVLPAELDAPPSTNFVFTEQEYQSALTTQLKTSLLNLIQNVRQTGLSDAVRTQMWALSTEQTSAQNKRLTASVRRQFASMGWNMPQGDEAIKIMEATQDSVNLDVTNLRLIATENARLEQSNFQFSFTQALGLENTLINLHNSTQQRAFEAARYAIEAAINLYQVKVAYFNAGVTIYTAQAQVYRDRIQAELSKLELYKSQLEGQRLISELNSQDIDNYRAQIEAVVAVFGLYQSELQAVKTQLEGDSLKIQQFEANIRAFAEEIRAKALEYEAYKTEWSGEEIKANVYDSLVSAFKGRIEAFGTSTDAKVKKLDADIRINKEIPLKVLEQRTQVFAEKIRAEVARTGAVSNINEIAARLHEINARIEETRLKSTTDIYRADIDAYIAQNETKSKEIESKNKTNENLIKLYDSQVNAKTGQIEAVSKYNDSSTEVFKARVQAKTSEIEGVNSIYKTDSDVYGTAVGAEGTRINAQVAVLMAQLEKNIKESDISIKAIELAVSTFLGQKELIINTLKTVAQVQAQLAASLSSTVSYNARIGSDVNYGDSHHTNHSYSVSESL